jgi:FAD/FMN-containing dehydrogenase
MVDVAALRRRLEATVTGEVRFDRASIAIYANDSSNFRQVPIGVVVPKTVEDIVATHRACAAVGAPIVNRGGGTSLSGETVNNALVIDTSKYMTRIGEPDGDARTVHVQPGAINEQVNEHVGPKVNLVFGPDPSTHSRCTIGGNVGNNSCGIHSVQSQIYGPGPRTSDNTEALEVVTYDGERFWVGVDEEDRLDEIIAAGGRKGEVYAQLRALRDRYSDLIRERMRPVTEMPRRVSGFNLDELLPERGFNVARALVGTESTCVTVTEAVLKLTPALLMRTLVVVEYDDLPAAGADVADIVERFKPIGLEGLDKELIEDQIAQHLHVSTIEELPREGQGDAWLLVQFGADTAEESQEQARRFMDWCRTERGMAGDRILTMKSAEEGGHSSEIWEIRESGLGATAFPPGERDHWPGWEDSAAGQVRPEGRDVRPLRPGLHPLADQLRPDARGRRARVPALPRRRVGPRREVQRVAVGRARRRPATRRVPRQAVRRGARRRHARVQAHLGPRGPHEPRQGHRPLSGRRQPQARHRLQPAAPGREVRLQGGPRRLRARDAALRRHRRVPRPPLGRGHVPELSGDARGGALHARARAHPVRDAPGRGHHRWLAEPGGA